MFLIQPFHRPLPALAKVIKTRIPSAYDKSQLKLQVGYVYFYFMKRLTTFLFFVSTRAHTGFCLPHFPLKQVQAICCHEFMLSTFLSFCILSSLHFSFSHRSMLFLVSLQFLSFTSNSIHFQTQSAGSFPSTRFIQVGYRPPFRLICEKRGQNR